MKLEYDEPLSNFDFTFNLRRYNEDLREHLTRLTERCGLQDEHHDKARQAGSSSFTIYLKHLRGMS